MLKVTATSVGCTIVALSIAFTAAACSAPSDSTQTLAETKSPTQLLRNQGASYFDDITEGDPVTSDKSQGCRTAEEDPDGLVRRWVSSIDLTLDATVTESIDDVPNRLLDPFGEKDWIVAYEAAREIGLTSQKTASTIQITPEAGPDGTMAGGHVLIVALGPCVDTDGAESDEVKQLESFSN
jgi:hypothetical protein